MVILIRVRGRCYSKKMLPSSSAVLCVWCYLANLSMPTVNQDGEYKHQQVVVSMHANVSIHLKTQL